MSRTYSLSFDFEPILKRRYNLIQTNFLSTKNIISIGFLLELLTRELEIKCDYMKSECITIEKKCYFGMFGEVLNRKVLKKAKDIRNLFLFIARVLNTHYDRFIMATGNITVLVIPISLSVTTYERITFIAEMVSVRNLMYGRSTILFTCT